MNDKTSIKEKSFMLPIWVITIVSMIGVFLISYAIHLYYLNERHTENLEQIENVNFRTNKLKEYRETLKEGEKNIKDKTLNN